MNDDQLFRYRIRAKIRDDVGRDGFSRVSSIGAGPGGGGPPLCFAYSIGLSHTNPACADILILGPFLQQELMGIVFDIAWTMLHEGSRYEAGKQYRVSVKGEQYPFPFFFGEVEPRYYPLYPKGAVDYYGSQSFPLLQVVWPDEGGAWPWEEAFSARFYGMQPLLFDPARYSLLGGSRTGEGLR